MKVSEIREAWHVEDLLLTVDDIIKLLKEWETKLTLKSASTQED